MDTLGQVVYQNDVPAWALANQHKNTLRILENEVDPFSDISELPELPDLEDFPF